MVREKEVKEYIVVNRFNGDIAAAIMVDDLKRMQTKKLNLIDGDGKCFSIHATQYPMALLTQDGENTILCDARLIGDDGPLELIGEV